MKQEIIEQFNKLFPDEAACREHLFRVRWPEEVFCPRCENESCYHIPKRGLMQCKECRLQFSVTTGTVMHGTKLLMRHWFLAMYLIAADQPCSARWLAAKLAINYRSALGLLRKIRYILSQENGPHPLSAAALGNRPIDAVLRKLFPDKHAEEEKQRNSTPEVVQRAVRIMLDRAAGFIRTMYRNVWPENEQIYVDEFYYRSTSNGAPERFGRLLDTSVMCSLMSHMPACVMKARPLEGVPGLYASWNNKQRCRTFGKPQRNRPIVG
ncbi:MAG: transposase [Paenibacillaceae bacterium]|nr:transposase [Paenibacillaceae bacterium]